MRARTMCRLLAVACLIIGLAACEQQEAETTTEEQVGGEDGDGEAATFVAVDIDWEETPSEMAGEVAVELVNDGGIEHNLVFESLGDEPVAEARGGETATMTVELDPGDQVFYCSVPGHREAGMEGTVTVAG